MEGLLSVVLVAIVWVALPIAFMVLVIYAIVRYLGWRRTRDVEPDPLAILAARYARGEIDDAEFRQRQEVLGASGRR